MAASLPLFILLCVSSISIHRSSAASPLCPRSDLTFLDPLRSQCPLWIERSSAMEVGPAARDVSDWRVAIPLLSPLDISPIPAIGDQIGAAVPPDDSPPEENLVEAQEGGVRRPAWKHPAAPFYYEPVPSNAPPFVVPHCA